MSRQKSRQRRKLKNLSLVAVAGLAGVASVIIIFVALIMGIWLDTRFNRDGMFIVIMLILSVPVSLYVMLKIVMTLVGRIVPQPVARKPDQNVPKDVEEE